MTAIAELQPVGAVSLGQEKQAEGPKRAKELSL